MATPFRLLQPMTMALVTVVSLCSLPGVIADGSDASIKSDSSDYEYQCIDYYEYSDGCRIGHYCYDGMCLQTKCTDYVSQDGCSDTYYCNYEFFECYSYYNTPTSPPTPAPPSGPPPAPPARPDSFATVSFLIKGAARDAIDSSQFAKTLSEVTKVQSDWIEVTISESAGTSMRRRRRLLQSDPAAEVDAKLYTDNTYDTLSIISTSVQSGDLSRKLASIRSGISAVEIIHASQNDGSSANVGAIVGGVIGGVAVLGAAGAGIALYMKKEKSSAASAADATPGSEAQTRSADPNTPPTMPEDVLTSSLTYSVPAQDPNSQNQTNPDIDLEEQRSAPSTDTGITLVGATTAPSQAPKQSARSFKLFSRASKPSSTSGSPLPDLPPTKPADLFLSSISEQIASNPGRSLSLGPHEVKFTDLQITNPIGEGSFGRVYAANLRGSPVAVKILLDTSSGRINDPMMNPDNYLSSSAPIMAKLQEEVALMSRMDHPNVVKFIGVCSMPPCIITELCSKGSLSDVIKEASRSQESAAALGWPRRLAMALDAAQGMSYLHSQNVIHRDLKSANMLVTDEYKVKISDFNLSKLLDDSTRSSSLAAMNPRWIAAELMTGARATTAADVFAFGVVLWQLLTLEVPWGNTNPWQIVNAVQNGQRLPIPARDKVPGLMPSLSCYSKYVALLEKCWAQNPEERPDIATVARDLRYIAASDILI